MIMQATLTNPIAAIHNHTHIGRPIDGRIIMAEQVMKTRSARLSILDPFSLTAPSLLAIGPSIMSEMPPQQYSAQNPVLKTGNKSMASAAMPLDAEMMLGSVFTYFSEPFSISASSAADDGCGTKTASASTCPLG